MEINIQATVGICSEYMSAPDADPAEVSVVIAPLKVISVDDSKLRVISGCNLWQSCHNDSCWYSLSSREKKKARPGKSSVPL